MADSIAAGSMIAHYRVASRLGQGGMGAVFLADDTRLGRRVALKVLPPDMAADPERMHRFVQEAKLASALTHPNVAYIYEIGQSGDVWFLAMEYVEGQTLATRIVEGPLDIQDILRIGTQAADALDDAHSKGIVHRDIKPANLMLTPRGYVKVLDFGLAKLESGPRKTSQETQLLTTTGLVLGTVQYMSPEQALGREVDHRSDIFSLGIVLYEMATGRLPFAGANASETMARILQSPPDAMARFNYDIPEELERVVRKCLEKDRDRRYQSARELMVDLKNLDRDSSGQRAVAEAAPRNERHRIGVMIVDDEELARQILREYLGSVPDIEILAECANGFEAVKVISERKPDLVFLDVQMPKLDGFEVLELIGEVPVIFVTAYDQYAMKAFDAHAVDYLLKPFNLDRFQKALARARERIGQKTTPAVELAASARPPQQYLQRVVVREGTKVHIIPVDRLDYAEAQDDYVELHSQGKTYLKQQTISGLEAGLDPDAFVRIHRSVIVNIERVAKIEPYAKDSRVAILTDGTQLSVSRAGYERLKALLGDKG